VARVESRQQPFERLSVIVACALALLFFSTVGFCVTGQIISASAEPSYRGTTITVHLTILNTSNFTWGVDNCPAYIVSVRAPWFPADNIEELVGYRWTAVPPGTADSVTFVGGKAPPDTGIHYLDLCLMAPESPGSCKYVIVDQTRIPLDTPEWPDLSVVGTVLQQGGQRGDPMTISLRVKNLGPGPVVRAFWIEVRLSNDRKFDFNNAVDAWVASQVVLPPMAAGEYHDYCLVGQVPDAPGGNLNVIMKCDVLNEVAESLPSKGEDNNEFVVPTPFIIYRAELALMADPHPLNGYPLVFVAFWIANAGNLASPACTARVYLSPHPTKPREYHWFDISVPPLDPNTSYCSTLDPACPWLLPNAPPADYHVLAYCDYDPPYAVDEYRKDNNVLDLGTIEILPTTTTAANLVVLQGRIAPSGAASRKARVSVSVANSGVKPASASKMALYLSASGTWRPTDPVWASDISVPALAPGKKFDYSGDLSVPAWATGAYRVIACCDATDAVAESDENNARDIGALSSPTGATHWSLYR